MTFLGQVSLASGGGGYLGEVSISGGVPSSLITGLTANRVVFGSASGGIGQSANLFWDITNSRLGIGTTTPAHPLDVNGNIRSNALVYAQAGVVLGNNGGVDRIGAVMNLGVSSAGVAITSPSVSVQANAGAVVVVVVLHGTVEK